MCSLGCSITVPRKPPLTVKIYGGRVLHGALATERSVTPKVITSVLLLGLNEFAPQIADDCTGKPPRPCGSARRKNRSHQCSAQIEDLRRKDRSSCKAKFRKSRSKPGCARNARDLI